MKTRTLFLSLLLLVVLLPAGGLSGRPVAAQDQDPVTISLEVGWDGYYKQGHLTPFRVTLANSGPDLSGQVVVELRDSNSGDTVRYQLPVVLPGQSRKTVTLVVGMDSYQSSVRVRLLSGNKAVAEQRAQVRQISTGSLLVGVVSGELVDLSVIAQMGSSGDRPTVAYLDLDSLPDDGVAWESLDLLVLNNVDTATLSPAQLQALRDWLGVGGHLLATGGPNWQKTAAALGDLLPVRVTGSVSAYDLSALDPGGQYTPHLIDGPFVAAEGALLDGQILLAQDDLPLLARRRVGLGTVDWLALDLALAPLRDWAGSEWLWQQILAAPSGRDLPWATGTLNAWAAREGLRSIPSLALPSALQMVIFSLLYTVLVGPINYLVLKRFKRTELAWVTIPVCILLFSALAYVTGFQLRGGDIVLNRLSLVYGQANSDSARARTLLGVFSPSRTTLDVEFETGTLVRPIQDSTFGGGDVTIEQNGRTLLPDLLVDVAGLRAFRADASVVPPTIVSRLRVEVGSSTRLLGQVNNQSGRLLQNCGLLIGGNVYELGDLEPGALANVDELLAAGRAAPAVTSFGSPGPYLSSAPFYYSAGFPTDKLIGGSNYYNDKDLNRRYQLIQALAATDRGLLPPQRAIFFAWADNDPTLWPVTVANHESQIIDTVGYFLELPLALNRSSADLVVPPALTTWQYLDQQWVGESGPYDFHLSNNWASFEYQPWESFELQTLREIRIQLDSPQGRAAGTLIRVALWDWEDENWVVDERITWGQTAIPADPRILGPSNAVRLRIEAPTAASISVDRMDVTYVGEGVAE